MCEKCQNLSGVEEWDITNINTSNWTKEDFEWFNKGPVCEVCIRDYFIKLKPIK